MTKSTKEPWANKSLENIDGEVWEDVIGFDGMYSVSNMGRVRSEKRFTGRVSVQERILSQSVGAKAAPCVRCCNNGKKVSINVQKMVADAFMKERMDGEVIIHKNKVQHDNRLSNLKIGTKSESMEINYRVGVSENWGIESIPKAYRKQFENNNVVKDENGVILSIVCQKCFSEKPVSEFYVRSETQHRRHECKACILVRMGVKDVGKGAVSKEMALVGLRMCTVCKETKSLDRDFGNSKNAYLGKSNFCKSCACTLNAKYRVKKRESAKLSQICEQ